MVIKKFRIYVTLYRICSYTVGQYGSTNQHLAILPVYFYSVYQIRDTANPHESITENIINEFNILE
jgi:hypothetical protein